jgi:hypothetical protein
MRINGLVSLVTILGMILIAFSSVCGADEEGGIATEGGFEILAESSVSLEMDQLRGSDDRVQMADQHLGAEGFSPDKEMTSDNFFGMRQSYNRTGEGDEADQSYEFFIQEYSNPGSDMAAAVGRMAVKSSDGAYAAQYTFILKAPKENVSAIEEYYVAASPSGLSVVEAKSWWTCMLGQLPLVGEECGLGPNVCAPAATSIVGYLGCVATHCGPSFSKSSACCNCGCRQWCSWAYGCCRM